MRLQQNSNRICWTNIKCFITLSSLAAEGNRNANTNMSMRIKMKTVLFCVPLLILLGCMHSPQAIEEPGTDIQGFVDFFEEYEALCPYFAHKEIDWKEMGLAYFPLIADCENQDQLIGVVIEMLAELEDTRISLYKVDEFWQILEKVYPYTREYESNYDMDVLIEQYLEPNGWAGWNEGYCHGFGWCDPALLPYAFLDTIPTADDTTGATDSLDAFIAECIELDVPAVILDIRMNPVGALGPYGTCGHCLMGRFTDHSRPGAIYRARGGPEYHQYADLRPAVYPRGPSHYTGTVILLTGENCRNMSENMTANFINFPNVVLVGDTTGGSVSTLSRVEIADFWYAYVVQTTILTNQKHWIEGAGIPPDFPVEATESDFAAGIDPVLDFAIELLEDY